MKGLVLGGGNTRGSFQCGVIYSLYAYNGYRPDFIIGNSIGSINAWILSRYTFESVYDFWFNIEHRSKYLRLNWRRCFHDGLFDMEPMRKLLLEYNAEPHTPVEYTVVNLKTGGIEYGSTIDHCIASASEPLFMRPVNGLMDGGIREQVPIRRAFDNFDPEITVISNNPIVDLPQATRIPANIFTISYRGIDIQTHESFLNDIRPYKDRIKLYAPARSPVRRFCFERDKIRKAIAYGIEVGKNGPINGFISK